MSALLGNEATRSLLMDGVEPPVVPFTASAPAIEFYEYLLGESDAVVENAGLKGTCRWWHPLLKAQNTYKKGVVEPWYDRYGIGCGVRIFRFLKFMSDPEFECWRGDSVKIVGEAIGEHFKTTGIHVRHLCPVTDTRIADNKERVKLCINLDHLYFGDAKQNAADGRFRDPEAILARVKDKELHKKEMSREASRLKKHYKGECIAFVSEVRRLRTWKFKDVAELYGLHPDVAKLLYDNPPKPPNGLNFQQEKLI